MINLYYYYELDIEIDFKNFCIFYNLEFHYYKKDYGDKMLLNLIIKLENYVKNNKCIDLLLYELTI
jgi:hypothetical protein